MRGRRRTKPGEVTLSVGPDGTVISPASDPRAVRQVRDACQRWLGEEADEDAAQAAVQRVRELLRTSPTRQLYVSVVKRALDGDDLGPVGPPPPAPRIPA